MNDGVSPMELVHDESVVGRFVDEVCVVRFGVRLVALALTELAARESGFTVVPVDAASLYAIGVVPRSDEPTDSPEQQALADADDHVEVPGDRSSEDVELPSVEELSEPSFSLQPEAPLRPTARLSRVAIPAFRAAGEDGSEAAAGIESAEGAAPATLIDADVNCANPPYKEPERTRVSTSNNGGMLQHADRPDDVSRPTPSEVSEDVQNETMPAVPTGELQDNGDEAEFVRWPYVDRRSVAIAEDSPAAMLIVPPAVQDRRATGIRISDLPGGFDADGLVLPAPIVVPGEQIPSIEVAPVLVSAIDVPVVPREPAAGLFSVDSPESSTFHRPLTSAPTAPPIPAPPVAKPTSALSTSAPSTNAASTNAASTNAASTNAASTNAASTNAASTNAQPSANAASTSASEVGRYAGDSSDVGNKLSIGSLAEAGKSEANERATPAPFVIRPSISMPSAVPLSASSNDAASLSTDTTPSLALFGAAAQQESASSNVSLFSPSAVAPTPTLADLLSEDSAEESEFHAHMLALVQARGGSTSADVALTSSDLNADPGEGSGMSLAFVHVETHDATPRVALRTTDLVVGFDKRVLVQPLSIELLAGDVLLVDASENVGRTTLLRTLAGHIAPLSGSLEINGLTISGHATDVRARRALGLSYVGNEPALVGELTVVENVELPLLATGTVATDARERAIARLCEARLASLMHRPADALSASESRLVAVVRSLIDDPAVLCVDDVTAGLGIIGMQQTLELLEQAQTRGTALIVVSADPRLVTIGGFRATLRDGVLLPVD